MNEEWLKQLEQIKPTQKCKIGTVSFFIYKVKNLYNPNWNSDLLKKITKEARKSYLRYGKMPLLDAYDKNAEIYLCRAVDLVSEEWLCLRFVPSQNEQSSLEDLKQYVYKGKLLSSLVAEKLLPKVKNFNNKIVAVSRVCGIPPYTVGPTRLKITNLPIKMKYAAKSFALINKAFFTRSKFMYMVGVFRKELLARILRFNKNLSLDLKDAHKILGLRSQEIRLNRKLLAYRFPGYFLNVTQLFDLLEKLIKRKDLTVASVKTFLKFYNTNFKKYLKEKKYIEILSMTEGLSKLLLTKGSVPKSKVTGEKLRELIMKNVSDGPVLKITPVRDWVKQLKLIKVKYGRK